MTEKRVPHIYLKDIAEIATSLDEASNAGEFLWLTGPVRLTDGETTYTLVNEDDSWWLDPDQTTSP